MGIWFYSAIDSVIYFSFNCNLLFKVMIESSFAIAIIKKNIIDSVIFIRVFFHRHWRFTGQQGKGGDHLLFHSTTSTRSRTFKHLFATLHVRWYHIFLIAPLVFTRLLLDEIYHLIELPFDWLIDDAMFVFLLDELILGFCYSNLLWRLYWHFPALRNENFWYCNWLVLYQIQSKKAKLKSQVNKG